MEPSNDRPPTANSSRTIGAFAIGGIVATLLLYPVLSSQRARDRSAFASERTELTTTIKKFETRLKHATFKTQEARNERDELRANIDRLRIAVSDGNKLRKQAGNLLLRSKSNELKALKEVQTLKDLQKLALDQGEGVKLERDTLRAEVTNLTRNLADEGKLRKRAENQVRAAQEAEKKALAELRKLRQESAKNNTN